MLEWLIIAVIAGFFAAVTWDELRDSIAQWLRDNDLEKSVLMDAVVHLDKVASRIRARVTVKRKGGKVHEVTTKYMRIEEITDPELVRRLRADSSAKKSILNEVH